MAPATKYGGKIVVCQPGTIATAKSQLTTVCTETTSGVARPASNNDATSYRVQCIADPRQTIAKIPETIYAARFRPRSLRVARSGISPTNQKSRETVAYVETANTSHTSGLRNCGHIHIGLG